MHEVKRNSRHVKINQLLRMYLWANSGDCQVADRQKDSLPALVSGVCNPLSDAIRCLIMADGFSAEQATEIYENYIQFGTEAVNTGEVVECINRYVKDYNWDHRAISSQEMIKNLFEKFGLTAGELNSWTESYLRIESVELFFKMQKFELFDYVYQNGWHIDSDEQEQSVLMFQD